MKKTSQELAEESVDRLNDLYEIKVKLEDLDYIVDEEVNKGYFTIYTFENNNPITKIKTTDLDKLKELLDRAETINNLRDTPITKKQKEDYIREIVEMEEEIVKLRDRKETLADLEEWFDIENIKDKELESVFQNYLTNLVSYLEEYSDDEIKERYFGVKSYLHELRRKKNG